MATETCSHRERRPEKSPRRQPRPRGPGPRGDPARVSGRPNATWGHVGQYEQMCLVWPRVQAKITTAPAAWWIRLRCGYTARRRLARVGALAGHRRRLRRHALACLITHHHRRGRRRTSGLPADRSLPVVPDQTSTFEIAPRQPGGTRRPRPRDRQTRDATNSLLSPPLQVRGRNGHPAGQGIRALNCGRHACLARPPHDP